MEIKSRDRSVSNHFVYRSSTLNKHANNGEPIGIQRRILGKMAQSPRMAAAGRQLFGPTVAEGSEDGETEKSVNSYSTI